jgi:serine/threonine-protein kinase
MFSSRWIVGGLLGKNETAEIYDAEATSERRFAAIKLFDRSLGLEPAWSEHVALTRALSELPGDGLARAYDVGIDPTLRRPYVATERITFPTIARYVSQRGALPLRVIAHALETLGAALDTAHAAGVVHGGLKPQNVFVSFENPHWARFTDFGVTQLRHAAGRGPATLLGWSTPEDTPSPAADRYALALICYFGATGTPWYSALRSLDESSSERALRHLASERAKSEGAELDPLFDAWFARALHADANARFLTATEMAKAFVDVFASAPTAEMPARASIPPSTLTAPIPALQGAGGLGLATARTLPATLNMPETAPVGAFGAGSEPPPRVPSEPPPESAQSFPPPNMPSFPPRPASPLPPRPASPLPPSATSSFPPRSISSVPPQASPLPPRGTSSFPARGSNRAGPSTPRWFWLACAGMALAAVLAVWWLSRH